MKTKFVKRHYCDYCKKSGGSKGHMKHHEERCTNNPDRKCGMCEKADQDQPSLPALIALLPSPADFRLSVTLWGEVPNDTYGPSNPACPGLDVALKEAMPKLEAASGDLECPACILAALRQSGIMQHVQSEFDFKKACEEFWAIVNNREHEHDMYLCHHG